MYLQHHLLAHCYAITPPYTLSYRRCYLPLSLDQTPSGSQFPHWYYVYTTHAWHVFILRGWDPSAQSDDSKSEQVTSHAMYGSTALPALAALGPHSPVRRGRRKRLAASERRRFAPGPHSLLPINGHRPTTPGAVPPGASARVRASCSPLAPPPAPPPGECVWKHVSA
jgi:hypothetical protein